MSETIWRLPQPSTSVVEHPTVTRLPRKELALSFALQSEDQEEPVRFRILFSGVESFKWTSLSSCSEVMIKSAYDRLVDCGNTPWLEECATISARVLGSTRRLSHLRIFFDDGPCFEAICEGASGFRP